MSEMMPREKALHFGISSLNNNELLALIIKSAYRDKGVLELAQDVIETADGFMNLLSLKYEELVSIKGIKEAKALEMAGHAYLDGPEEEREAQLAYIRANHTRAMELYDAFVEEAGRRKLI